MHFDATVHLGDLIPVVVMVVAAYQRMVGVLRSIEAFMEESRNDRLTLHKRLEMMEHRYKPDRRPSAAAKLTEERMGK